MEIRIDDYNGRIHVSNVFGKFHSATKNELENIFSAVKMYQKRHSVINTAKLIKQ